MRLGKAARLRRRREFLAVQQRGERLFGRELLVLALDRGEGRARLGITVPGKVANAVTRNRVKRWVREAFRAVAKDLPPVDLVVIGRTGCGAVGLAGAQAALQAARDRLAPGGRR